MDLSSYLLVVRRRWWVVLLAAAVFAGLAVSYGWVQTPSYEADAEIYVSLRGQETAPDLVAGSTFARQQVLSYADMVDAPIVLDPVIAELGLPWSAETLASSITSMSPSGTSLITVTVATDSAERSARIANAVADSATTVLEDLEQPDGGAVSTVHLTVVSPATVPDAASSPRQKVNFAVGLVVGTLLGLLAALLLEAADRTVRRRGDLARTTSIPVLAEIPAAGKGGSRLPLSTRSGPDPRADAVRMLRANVHAAARAAASPAGTILVTAVLPSVAKSATTLELAVAWADTGSTVLVIDADPRKAVAGREAGVIREPGLANALNGSTDWRSCVRHWSRETLHVLPAGSVSDDAGTVLDSERLSSLLAECSAAYDVVLLDVAPVLAAPDVASLASKVDGVLVLVGAGRTSQGQVADSLETVAAAGGRVLGLVLTGASGSDGPWHAYAAMSPDDLTSGRGRIAGPDTPTSRRKA